MHPEPEGGTQSASPLAGTFLSRSPFLGPEDLQALERCASPPKGWDAGADLIGEGESADRLLVLLSGWACRYATMSDGRRQLSAILGPGDVGNLGSLMLDRIDYGVRTLGVTTVVTLPRDRLLALSDERPGIARTFTWLALIENAMTREWLRSIGRRTSRERLAHLLCEWGERLGSAEEKGCPLTQEQMADALGLTPVHVNRTMQQLRTEGLVGTKHRSVTLSNPGRLREVAEFDPGYLYRGGERS